MNWSDLGNQIASAGAKMLGEVIPVPGAGIVADQVAQALGTDKDPDAIAQALKSDPEAAAKLKQIEAQHKEELERIRAEADASRDKQMTARQAAVNDTIQTGYQAGVLWRRAVGWSLAVVVPLVVLGVLALAGAAIALERPGLIEHIPAVVSALGPVWYVYMVVLGVAGYQEGKMCRTLAGETEGGIARAIKAIKGTG